MALGTITFGVNPDLEKKATRVLKHDRKVRGIKGVEAPRRFVPMRFIHITKRQLRERRKILGLVWPHREHSLGFQQARDLVTELMVEYGMFKKFPISPRSKNSLICLGKISLPP